MQTNASPSLDPQSAKSPFRSQTILGIAVAGIPTIVLLLKSFLGVDIADLSDDLAKGIVGTVGLVGAIVAIIGRFRARGPLSVAPTVNLSLIAALLLPAFLFASCSNLSPETQAKASATGSVLAQKAMNIALGTVVAAAQSATDSSAKGDWLDSLATGFRSQLSISSDDIKQIVQIWTPADKAHWSVLAAELAQFYEQTARQPEAERIEAIAYGLNLAAERARAAHANPPQV